MQKFLPILFLLLPLYGHGKLLELSSHPETSKFFPSYNSTVFILGLKPDAKVFGDLNSSSAKRIRKIPSTYLNEVGIKEGMLLQTIDFARKSDPIFYRIKKEVFVLMNRIDAAQEDPKKNPYWAHFSLILSDSPEFHKSLENETFTRFPSGVTYAGNKIKFKKSSMQSLIFKPILPSDELFNKISNELGFKNGKISFSTFKNFKVIITQDASTDDVNSYIELKGNIYPFPNQTDALSCGFWIDDIALMPIGDLRDGYGCMTFLLISDKEIQKVEPKCEEF